MVSLHARDSWPAIPDLPADAGPWQFTTCAASGGGREVFFATSCAVWKLDGEDKVFLVAGVARPPAHGAQGVAAAPIDGGGLVATFVDITAMAKGWTQLYVLDSGRLRVLQLAPSDASSPAALAVTTLTPWPHADVRLVALSYDYRKAALYAATRDVVYRLLEPLTAQPAPVPVVVAGREERDSGGVVGRSPALVALSGIAGIAIAEDGDLLVMESEYGQSMLRTFAMPGCTELSSSVWPKYALENLCILPSGGAASVGSYGLELWPGGVKPSRAPHPSPLRPLNGQARLGSDLSAQLAPQPCSPPDLTLVIGGRAFAVHRAILGARCEYFARCFAGEFSDSGSATVQLPDADPEAFEPLLSYVYGGELCPPPRLVRAMAVLADRLLLPEASSHLQQQVLATTQAAAVVDDMLWAEQHAFVELLAGLKRRYVGLVDLVADSAPESIERLAARSPLLHRELHAEVVRQMRSRG